MERLANDLVRDVRPVVVACVDMVDPGGNCLSQYGEGRLTIARRSPCHRAGEVNRTVADSSEGEGSAGRCEGAAEIHRLDHACLRVARGDQRSALLLLTLLP